MKTAIMTPAALLILAVLSVTAKVLAREGSSSVAPPPAPPEAESLPAPACPGRLRARDAERFDAAIIRHSRRRGLNPNLVKAVIAVESQFTPTALSHCGARGLMQVMPATAKDLGVEADALWDPDTNISAGTTYLALLFKLARKAGGADDADEARMTRHVIAAYYAGPGALATETWSTATRDYVRAVLSCEPADGASARAGRTDGAVASLRAP